MNARITLIEAPDALDLAERWESIAKLGDSSTPMLAVDLRGVDRSFCQDDRDRRLSAALMIAPWVSVAVVGPNLDVTLAPLADSFDVLIGEGSGANAVVDVDDVDGAVDRLRDRITASAAASVSLARLLRLTHNIPVEQALHAESLTYAMLQSGATFKQWLSARPAPRPLAPEEPPLLVERSGSLLRVTLNRPQRRNALNVAMRDALAEALELLDLDLSLDGAVLEGTGANFCAGGDLDEFGTTPSAALGHHVRTVRSLGALIHRLSGRIRVHLHGACVGAGIELPAFADSVIAGADASFRLPEIGLGLVPGAGGTVSITRRCGRHRTAWFALSGATIDAQTALSWSLVDRIDTASTRPED